ncbi:hypothetical protein DFR30_2061 [Thiogranum longum]|uniref:Uncharacterized protein n=1 Tax=Thiogranum longum TaxID=1537524 RepID=A0A4R1HA25_9GAMM|nr:putative DNA-binding domain-containing protein [Thiogranum longum]TCK18777.1 hypothetical protein DFR30_2061 [Thiogranum longum]
MARQGFRQQQYAFAAHIRQPDRNPAPDDIEDRRMAIYRDLFYNNVEGFLSGGFPVLRELMDDTSWHAMVRDFFARHHCHSPLFMEISREFLAYLEQERGAHENDFPFLRELAHYEWVELALSIAEEDPVQVNDPDGDLLEGTPVLSSLAWPLSYHYPVHQIAESFQPETPAEQPVYLMVYRDKTDEVNFIELNAISARLFSLLQEDDSLTGRETLEKIAAELKHPKPEVVIEGGRQILEAWRQRDIVLGVNVPNSTNI